MKSIIKLFYVIILPLALLISSISYLINAADPSYIAVATLFIAVVFNSVFWLSHMDRTSIWPIIHVQVLPMIGLGILIDNDKGLSDTTSLMIMLPFVGIEFRNRINSSTSS